MSTQDDVAQLERRGWEALSSEPAAAAAFYGDVLDGFVVMLLPGGLFLDDRASILAAMSGQSWSSYGLENVRVLELTPDTAVVTYAITAQRDGQPEYRALVASTYVRREDSWKLAVHQQTPR